MNLIPFRPLIIKLVSLITVFSFLYLVESCRWIGLKDIETNVTDISLEEEIFLNPPEEAKPWVFWYWMNANVSKEGITGDLEAMASQGIGGVYLFSIGMQNEKLLIEKPANPLTEYWWELIEYAVNEADRLGLKIALNACDGWATAASPEITPELSMQKLVWSEQKISGGQLFNGFLEQPESLLGYYRDIAVWAYPEPVPEPLSSNKLTPDITTNIPGINPYHLQTSDKAIISKNGGWIQFYFNKPLTCRSVTFTGVKNNIFHAFHPTIEISPDGTTWKKVVTLSPPFVGGQQSSLSYCYGIKPVSSQFFRFTFDISMFDPAHWQAKYSTGWLPGYYQPVLGLDQIIIDEDPVIDGWIQKNGSSWGQIENTNAEILPDSVCVKESDMINLTGTMDPEGMLTWRAPAGNNWIIHRFGYTTTGKMNGPASSGQGLEADKLNSASVPVVYNSWFGKAHSRVQEYGKDKVLMINHTDSWECYSQNWSPVFRQEFLNRRGYDPVNYLPAMTGIPIESADISERFLFDIRQTISELVLDNFYVPLVRLTHNDGAQFSAEAMAPIMMSDGMAHYGRVDIPMGEFWLQSPLHDKPNDIMDAIHAARVYGKNIVQAEAFTQLAIKWDEDPYLLKTLGDYNFSLGINRLVLHVWAHKATIGKPGITLAGIGTEFSKSQTWWEAGKGWFDYLRRTQAMLQQGSPVVDILYYTGENQPVRALMPENLKPQLPDGYSYNSINRDALLNQAKAKDGYIYLPGKISCRILVLPDEDRMTPEVAKKISQILKAGVIVIGSKPKRSWSLSDYPYCDQRVQDIVKTGWGKICENVTLENKFKEAKLEKDVSFEDVDLSFVWRETQKYKSPSLVWTHRAMKDVDIYFLSNQEYNVRKLIANFRITGKIPELWHPETGEIRELPEWSVQNGITKVSLKFDPAESYFIVFRKKGSPIHGNKSNFPEFNDIMDLKGPWEVNFEMKKGVLSTLKMGELSSLHLNNQEDVRYYSGNIVYKKAFHIEEVSNERFYIQLGDVKNLAVLYLNGKEVSKLWKPPFRAEVTGFLMPGDNFLEVHVSNTWRNRIIGDLKKAPNERITKLPLFPLRNIEDLGLIGSGLLGPVKILKLKN